jgi:hypothetical protein
MIKFARLCLNEIDQTWFDCIIAKEKHPEFCKYQMTFEAAKMFCFMYSENGDFGWRLPTQEEATNNKELAGCWHQGDDQTENSLTYYVRPVKDV